MPGTNFDKVQFNAIFVMKNFVRLLQTRKPSEENSRFKTIVILEPLAVSLEKMNVTVKFRHFSARSFDKKSRLQLEGSF